MRTDHKSNINGWVTMWGVWKGGGVVRQCLREKCKVWKKTQPYDREWEHMEALPSATINTFMHSLDLTYGFVKLLVHHLSTICPSSSVSRGLRQIPHWTDPEYQQTPDNCIVPVLINLVKWLFIVNNQFTAISWFPLSGKVNLSLSLMLS